MLNCLPSSHVSLTWSSLLATVPLPQPRVIVVWAIVQLLLRILLQPQRIQPPHQATVLHASPRKKVSTCLRLNLPNL